VIDSSHELAPAFHSSASAHLWLLAPNYSGFSLSVRYQTVYGQLSNLMSSEAIR